MTDEDLKEAMEHYEASIAMGKSPYLDAEMMDDIANFYADEARYPKAYEAIRYGLELHPGNADLLLTQTRLLLDENRVEEAEEVCAQITEESVDLYLLQAEFFLLRGEAEKAEEKINKVMEEEGEDIDTLKDIAFAYEDAGFHGKAIPFLEKAIALSSFDADLYEELALDYLYSDQTPLAIEWLNKLLDLDPYSQSGWLRLCKAYMEDGDFHKAIDAAEYLLAIDEECAPAYNLLGTCYFEIGNDQKGVEHFERYKELEKGEPIAVSYANYAIGMGYYLMKNYDEAIRYFSKVEDEGFLDMIYSTLIDFFGEDDEELTNNNNNN